MEYIRTTQLTEWKSEYVTAGKLDAKGREIGWSVAESEIENAINETPKPYECRSNAPIGVRFALCVQMQRGKVNFGGSRYYQEFDSAAERETAKAKVIKARLAAK